MYAFSKSLRHRNHTRRFTIVPSTEGWEVVEEQDSRVVRQAHYRDWHRVERVRRAFTLEMRDLERRGWAEVG